jgi:hypothetical protein
MTTIYIPVEVDDSRLAEFLVGSGASLSVPNAPDPMANVPDPNAQVRQDDPWSTPQQNPVNTGQQTTGAMQYPQAPTPSAGYAPSTSSGYAPQSASSAPQMPSCQHGTMKFVPAGIAQRTGKPYPAFWGCQADRNDPTRCKSLPA